ncbi:hypothetical protein SO802_002052 [Lithocarpus litseifolius]|uniref:Uncharacterized protein n=1 Tax=Lithocarpus litseifolius TaxID=425828 RepID=A0AAW2DZM1_9ROSI
MDETRECMYEENRVKEHVQAGFGKLYTSEMSMSLAKPPVSNFLSCFFSNEERNWIGRAVSNEETRYGLWALEPFKAPGPGGLHAGFFQHYW